MAEKTKITGKQILEELKAPALIVVGMVGGNLAGKLVDKVLKVDSSASGFNAKALASPVVQITAGIGGAILLKDKNLKLVACGVAASGVAATVKVLLKKDLLAGFSGLGNTLEALNEFRNNFKLEPYSPHLPELDNVQIESLPVEVDLSGKADYADYEEIDSIQIL